jgi:hypothetical protein
MHEANVFLLPGNVAYEGIGANVQDLGIERGELFEFRVERRQL